MCIGQCSQDEEKPINVEKSDDKVTAQADAIKNQVRTSLYTRFINFRHVLEVCERSKSLSTCTCMLVFVHM